MSYDLTDKIYNDWTVLYECERPKGVKSKDKYWMCQCKCGTIKPVSGRMLRTNKSKCCGCIRDGINRIDLTNKVIGDVKVIKEVYKKSLYTKMLNIKGTIGFVNVNVEMNLLQKHLN